MSVCVQIFLYVSLIHNGNGMAFQLIKKHGFSYIFWSQSSVERLSFPFSFDWIAIFVLFLSVFRFRFSAVAFWCVLQREKKSLFCCFGWLVSMAVAVPVPVSVIGFLFSFYLRLLSCISDKLNRIAATVTVSWWNH